jgi:hypothetical protein
VNGFSSELKELIAALEELLNTSNVALILSGNGKLEFIWPRFRSQIVSNNCINGIMNAFRP